MALQLGLGAASLLARPAWDDQPRVLQGNSVHPSLARLEPLGPVPPDLPMEGMVLVLKLAPESRSRLEQLLGDPQDPGSPRYHQWLTPDQFGAQFGPTRDQLEAFTGWLASQGFTVAAPARSGLSIPFSGTAATLNPGSGITGLGWAFGDGAGPSGASASHTFPSSPGAPYTVTLTATDSTGAAGQASLSVLASPSALDVNGDGTVDVCDLLVIAGAWNPDRVATAGALNGLNLAAVLDGGAAVDDTDLGLWIQNFTPGMQP